MNPILGTSGSIINNFIDFWTKPNTKTSSKKNTTKSTKKNTTKKYGGYNANPPQKKNKSRKSNKK